MIFYTLFTLLFSFLLFYFTPKEFSSIESITEIWAWDKANKIGMRNDSRFKIKSQEILNAYKTDKGIYFINRSEFALPENSFTEYPLLGKGHILYKKVGSTILYYSNTGELLWEKEFKSYPRVNLDGSLIFLVAGDGNQVLILNQDGNLTGSERVDGRFLTDIQYSKNTSLLAFSGGEVYLLDSKGKILHSKTEDSNSKDNVFLKSASISLGSKRIALHYFRNDKDLIILLNENFEIINTIPLDRVYPHKIFMGLSDRGDLILNLPDKVIIYNDKAKLVFGQKKENEPVYQIAFANDSIFAFSSRNELHILNKDLVKVKTRKIGFESRIIPSFEDSLFFLETDKEIISYTIWK